MAELRKLSDSFLTVLQTRGIVCDGQWKILYQNLLKLEIHSEIQEREIKRLIAEVTTLRRISDGTAQQ